MEAVSQPQAPVFQAAIPVAEPTPTKPASKKLGILIGVALAVVAAVIAVIAFWPKGEGSSDSGKAASYGNTFETPVKILEAQVNSKTYVPYFDQLNERCNGFAKDEIEELIRLLKSASNYQANFEEAKAEFESQLEQKKEILGDDYKYSYAIAEKVKLEEEPLGEVRVLLQAYGQQMIAYTQQSDNFSDSDWEHLAIGMGMSVSDAKKYVSTYKALGEKLASAELTECYQMVITQTLVDDESEEPIEFERNLTVCLVDGRWVELGDLTGLRYFQYS